MTIGDRIRDERKRMGLSQSGMGELAGVTKMSQINYEKAARAPDSDYLSAIAAAGADVQYILTGQRSVQALTRDEVELLEAFRAAPLAVKAAAIGALQGGSASPGKIKQTVSALAGQVAAGSVVTQTQGDVHVGGAGGKRKR